MVVYIVQYVCGYDNIAEIISAHSSMAGAEAARDAAKHRQRGWDCIEIVELDLED